jgi:hypothetical protein
MNGLICFGILCCYFGLGFILGVEAVAIVSRYLSAEVKSLPRGHRVHAPRAFLKTSQQKY